MEYNNKTLCLLKWDGENGKFNKFYLTPALIQNTDGEFHILIGQKIIEVEGKKIKDIDLKRLMFIMEQYKQSNPNITFESFLEGLKDFEKNV